MRDRIALLTTIVLGLFLLLFIAGQAPIVDTVSPGLYDFVFPPMVSNLYAPDGDPSPAYAVDNTGNQVVQVDDLWIGTSANTNISFDDTNEELVLSIGPNSDLVFAESQSAVAIALGYPGNIEGNNASLDNYVNPQAYSAIAMWGRGNEIRATGVGYQTIINGYSNIVKSTGNIVGGSSNRAIAMGEGGIFTGEQNEGWGEESILVGGNENYITGTNPINIEDFLGGGYQNGIEGEGADDSARSGIGWGWDNRIKGADTATIGGGYSNTITMDHAIIPGGYGALARHYAEAAYASGYFSAGGDAQRFDVVMRNDTTDATQTELFLDGAAERLTLPDDTTWYFEVTISARRTDADNESAAYLTRGCIDRNAGVGTTALVGAVDNIMVKEDSGAWAITVDADAGNGSLRVRVTGENAKAIQWVAHVSIVQTTG